MKKLILAVVLSVFSVSVAGASPLLVAGSINGGALLFCAADNNVGCANGTVLLDLDPTIGILSLGSTNLLGLVIEGSFQQVALGPPQNLLSSSSLTITNTTGAAITSSTSVSNIGYPGPATNGSATGSGTWVNADLSTALYTYYVDSLNGQGGETALDRPGTLVYSFNDTAAGNLDSFSANSGLYPLLTGNPFSMTLGFDMTLGAGGQLISRGQSEIANVAAVPEPASLILLGSGLAGIAAKARKRHNRKVENVA